MDLVKLKEYIDAGAGIEEVNIIVDRLKEVIKQECNDEEIEYLQRGLENAEAMQALFEEALKHL